VACLGLVGQAAAQAGSAPPLIIKFSLGTLLKIFVDDLGEAACSGPSRWLSALSQDPWHQTSALAYGIVGAASTKVVAIAFANKILIDSFLNDCGVSLCYAP